MLLQDAPIKRVYRRDIIEQVFVVDENYFLAGALPSYRSGMSGVYRLRFYFLMMMNILSILKKQRNF
jgi:hypothetical protein